MRWIKLVPRFFCEQGNVGTTLDFSHRNERSARRIFRDRGKVRSRGYGVFISFQKRYVCAWILQPITQQGPSTKRRDDMNQKCIMFRTKKLRTCTSMCSFLFTQGKRQSYPLSTILEHQQKMFALHEIRMRQSSLAARTSSLPHLSFSTVLQTQF